MLTDNPLRLTMEQRFELRRMRDAAETMSREQALELLKNATRLLMVKNNVLQAIAPKTFGEINHVKPGSDQDR